MIPFIPLFFFASMYAQISLGESASETGLYLLIFFAGFAIASQYGGRILDRVGRPPLGGPRLRRRRGRLRSSGRDSMPDLSVSSQWYYIVIAGAGVRAGAQPRPTPTRSTACRRPLRRGDRDHADGAQLRLQPRHGRAGHDPDPAEQGQPGVDARPPTACRRRAPTKSPTSISQGSGSRRSAAASQRRDRQGASTAFPHDFALATQTVFYAMAGVMAVAFVVALVSMPAGKVESRCPSRAAAPS